MLMRPSFTLPHSVINLGGWEMEKDTLENKLRELLPKSLDDVIRENREQLRLALATAEEMKGLETRIAEGPVYHALKRWNIVMLHVTDGGKKVSSPRLVGTVHESQQSWITSHVEAIDTEHGLVQTRNSLYRILGPRADEDALDLLRICASLHEWGLGARFGVPHIFY